jgi:hypothetical protein
MSSLGGPSPAMPGDGRGFSIKHGDLRRVTRTSLASYRAPVGAAVLISCETVRADAGMRPGADYAKCDLRQPDAVRGMQDSGFRYSALVDVPPRD